MMKRFITLATFPVNITMGDFYYAKIFNYEAVLVISVLLATPSMPKQFVNLSSIGPYIFFILVKICAVCYSLNSFDNIRTF